MAPKPHGLRWDYRGPCMAQASFQCLVLYLYHATFEYHFLPLFIRIPRNYFQVDINQ